MTRHVSILRRKPRTRRERMLVRFHAAREGVSRKWARLHSHRRRRAAQRRARELFLHLGHRLHPEPVEPIVPASRRRPHIHYHR